MKRYRYMVVKYHQDTEKALCVEKGLFKNHLPVHELLCEYHWVRLDAEHVLVTGEYPIGHHDKLAKHEHVYMLPSIGSNRRLHTVLSNPKSNFTAALLKKYNMPIDSSMSDLIDALETQEAPLFAPIR